MAVIHHHCTGQRKDHAGLCQVPGINRVRAYPCAILPAFAFIPKARIPMPEPGGIITLMLDGIHESIEDGSDGNQ